MLALLLGGIGLFLLGMTLLTDGLKVLAGDALRRVLARFTGGPTRAMLSGAALTALIQSSSATTLATIGFVSAGLLTFQQAVGLVFGANLGTTSTAWLVSLLGLKLSVSAVALPLVGVGALARLLARDRWAAAGTALSGFGLVFVGIDTLQAGMADLAAQIDPEALPGASLGGLDPAEASARLEMTRWLDRVGYHAWRAIVHLDARAAAPQALGEEDLAREPGSAA